MPATRYFVYLTLLLILSGCASRKVAVSDPPAIPQHLLLYREGIAAFREATPEGYQRAIELLRDAAGLQPALCEYRLQLAQSLMFLALEQKSNWEEFAPREAEAAAIIDAAEPSPGCAPLEPFVRRLRAISWSPEYQNPGPAAISRQIQIRRITTADLMGMINRALEIDPMDPLNWVALWKINPTDSRAPLDRAHELAPDLPLIQNEIGNLKLIVGQYAEAKQAFETALTGNPRYFRAAIGRAYSIGAADPNADVLPLYQKAVEIAPHYLEAHTLLGSYYAGIEESEKAIEQYEAALATNPGYHPAYLALGITFLRTARLEEAERALRKVVELDYSASEAHLYLGNIEFSRGDFAKAKERFEESLKYRVNFPEAIYFLGNVAYREGKIDEAQAAYDRVIQVSADYADAYVMRGDIRAQRRQIADATSDYQQAVRLFERAATKLMIDAQSSEARGWIRKALAERTEAMRLSNQVARVRLLIAQTSER